MFVYKLSIYFFKITGLNALSKQPCTIYMLQFLCCSINCWSILFLDPFTFCT